LNHSGLERQAGKSNVDAYPLLGAGEDHARSRRKVGCIIDTGRQPGEQGFGDTGFVAQLDQNRKIGIGCETRFSPALQRHAADDARSQTNSITRLLRHERCIQYRTEGHWSLLRRREKIHCCSTKPLPLRKG
jgi:hypothetical protein